MDVCVATDDLLALQWQATEVAGGDRVGGWTNPRPPPHTNVPQMSPVRKAKTQLLSAAFQLSPL